MLELKLSPNERKNSAVRGFYDSYNQKDNRYTPSEKALLNYLSRNKMGQEKIRKNGAFRKVLDSACEGAIKGRAVDMLGFMLVIPDVIDTLPSRERQRYLKKYPFLKEKMETGG